jgi:hypothetical protein
MLCLKDAKTHQRSGLDYCGSSRPQNLHTLAASFGTAPDQAGWSKQLLRAKASGRGGSTIAVDPTRRTGAPTVVYAGRLASISSRAFAASAALS